MMRPQRILCIDLGDKRTGLAVGDTIMRIASPAGVIEVPTVERDGAALIEALSRAVREHGATALLVGLPLNMDGTEGPRAKLVRVFAARVSAACGLPVEFQDERLTSASADWQMARSGMTRGQKKAKRDALAAAAILSDYLKRSEGGHAGSEAPPGRST